MQAVVVVGADHSRGTEVERCCTSQMRNVEQLTQRNQSSTGSPGKLLLGGSKM